MDVDGAVFNPHAQPSFTYHVCMVGMDRNHNRTMRKKRKERKTWEKKKNNTIQRKPTSTRWKRIMQFHGRWRTPRPHRSSQCEQRDPKAKWSRCAPSVSSPASEKRKQMSHALATKNQTKRLSLATGTIPREIGKKCIQREPTEHVECKSCASNPGEYLLTSSMGCARDETQPNRNFRKTLNRRPLPS